MASRQSIERIKGVPYLSQRFVEITADSDKSCNRNPTIVIHGGLAGAALLFRRRRRLRRFFVGPPIWKLCARCSAD